jgi:phage terminase small subunit
MVTDPPIWLGEEGIAEWERALAKLGPAVNPVLLGMYCRSYERWLALEFELDTDGGPCAPVKGKRGKVIGHKLRAQFVASTKLLEKVHQLAASLGLTPAADGKLKRPGLPGGNEPTTTEPTSNPLSGLRLHKRA